MRTLLASANWSAAKAIGLTFVAVLMFSVPATVAAAAETVTTEEPVVLENGEPAVQVSQVTADAVTTATAAPIKCKKVYGWHGLKHPLFGYFYWFFSARAIQ